MRSSRIWSEIETNFPEIQLALKVETQIGRLHIYLQYVDRFKSGIQHLDGQYWNEAGKRVKQNPYPLR